jgi:hypothetical protein
MANIEVIELENYPIWTRQPPEPEEKFLIFQGFFLSLPKANLTEAYRQFVAESGGDRQSVKDVSSQWREDCQKYRWKERHAAYWRKKNLEDLERRDERIRQYHEECLNTASLLKQRAEEILTNFDPAEAGPKDACQLLRLSRELTEEALSLGDLDKAAMTLFRNGFQVGVPDGEWAATGLAEMGQHRLQDTEKSWEKFQGG